VPSVSSLPEALFVSKTDLSPSQGLEKSDFVCLAVPVFAPRTSGRIARPLILRLLVDYPRENDSGVGPLFRSFAGTWGGVDP